MASYGIFELYRRMASGLPLIAPRPAMPTEAVPEIADPAPAVPVGTGTSLEEGGKRCPEMLNGRRPTGQEMAEQEAGLLQIQDERATRRTSCTVGKRWIGPRPRAIPTAEVAPSNISTGQWPNRLLRAAASNGRSSNGGKKSAFDGAALARQFEREMLARERSAPPQPAGARTGEDTPAPTPRNGGRAAR